VFLDPASLEPYKDQWTYLASIPRMSPEAVAALEKTLTPVAAGPDDTRYQRPAVGEAHQKPPEVIRAVSGAMLAIDRIGVPPALVAALKHLASLHNPEYHEKERLRFYTWNTPRFLRSYGETIDQLPLPRGIADDVARLVGEAGALSKSPTRARRPRQSRSRCRPISRTVSRALWMRADPCQRR
jgi:hypothetical protein